MFVSDREALLAHAESFAARLRTLKSEQRLAEYGWYPYDSLTAVPFLSDLLQHDLPLIRPLLAVEPVLDLGCGDGDLAFLFESLGARVDAVDWPSSNFNQMRGVHSLKSLLNSSIAIHERDIDRTAELPRRRYSLGLFLGTLYHLKNPYLVLETLARRCAYAIVSTRVARHLPDGAPICHQPVAYLLNPREANNDPTNYWIFSETGLLRLVDRAGWAVRSQLNVGCTVGSNPVDPNRDERMFLLLRSKVRFPEMQIRLLDGFHAVEQSSWRWTACNFAFEVHLPAEATPQEFALDFELPSDTTATRIGCTLNGYDIGESTFDRPGRQSYRGVFPSVASAPYRFKFTVQRDTASTSADTRDLGIIISYEHDPLGAGSLIPFRVS